MVDAYRQWISNYQCKPGFVNNFFSAVLFLNMEDNHTTYREFPIPLFALEEELEREDGNVQLPPGRATVSPALKYLLIHLLRKCTQERVNVSNYEEVLRATLARELPEGLGNPLTSSSSFHCLPTVCKVYIIGTLRRLSKLSNDNLKAAVNDCDNNVFYALPGGRVYVYVKTGVSDEYALDAAKKQQPWYSLYKETKRYRFNLLSETESEWKLVEGILERHGQSRVVSGLKANMKGMMKDQEYLQGRRAVRDMFLPFLASIDAAETFSRPAQRQSRTSTESATRDLAGMSLIDWKRARCQFFPQCPSGRNCEAIHPEDECVNFLEHRRCPGQACFFLHGPCPVDGYCDDENCIYEHYESLPVAMRMRNEAPKRVNGNGKRNIRCQHFPKCRTTDDKCRFVHPNKKCRDFFDTICVHGKLCVYLHGNCPNDGHCDDFECPHEHYNSLPLAQRPREPKRRWRESRSTERHRSRSRAVSERFARESSPEYDNRSRRSHISNSASDSDEDDDEEQTQDTKTAVEQRCRFYPRCTKKSCSYVHPKDPCKAFPSCPYGGACLFVHKTCPKDGVCVKLSCNFEHKIRRKIGQTWCMNGSVCKKKCTFLHPKECKAPCTSPGSCWMYHPPGAAAAATNDAAPAAKAAGRDKSAARDRPSSSRTRTFTAKQRPNYDRR